MEAGAGWSGSKSLFEISVRKFLQVWPTWPKSSPRRTVRASDGNPPGPARIFQTLVEVPRLHLNPKNRTALGEKGQWIGKKLWENKKYLTNNKTSKPHVRQMRLNYFISKRFINSLIIFALVFVVIKKERNRIFSQPFSQDGRHLKLVGMFLIIKIKKINGGVVWKLNISK